ncbi:MAG TPA: saccharopine dehydrogenase NADP-binding domain-containing protein [Acidimicrobiales bacterium]|nr:saccharopine dehydrogenase NADP-binding domain-containing protein [Acidimicrobiales bacterium]
MDPAAEFDVVLYGPTGVTGREVARHLARRAPALGLTWAVAGRSSERMSETLDMVGADPDAMLIADSADQRSIDTMVGSATVVANLVGPYARYGEPVYDACARLGRAELDLTGEVDWVRTMINRHEPSATASGARIVPTAGFESLPFDLGARLAAETAYERHGSPVVRVDVACRTESTGSLSGMSDAVSGGTYTSGVEALRRGGADGFTDAHLLDPATSSASGGYRIRPRRHSGTNEWLAPMVPSPFLNPPVAHRSAALLRAEGSATFAHDYEYVEGTVVASILPGSARAAAPAVAGALSAFQTGFGLVGRAPAAVRGPIADFATRIGPKPGEGPPVEKLDDWTYRLDVRATCASGRHVDVVVEADGHPGYKSTATMVGEAALLMADPNVELPAGSGFLTPSTALGIDHLDRFSEAACRFSVN